jgi:outer membrane scaffolding protein for murein synthesis (MipA/OmpV family)
MTLSGGARYSEGYKKSDAETSKVMPMVSRSSKNEVKLIQVPATE